MPLSFPTRDRGPIAFGFFNIETDLLLLEQYFFFACDFCAAIPRIAKEEHSDESFVGWPGFEIQERGRIGDLMGSKGGKAMGTRRVRCSKA